MPLFAGCALLIVSVSVALPEKVALSESAPPLKYQRSDGVGTPETVAGIVTVLPVATAWFTPCNPLMPGVTMTVSVMLFVAAPRRLLATSEYTAPSCANCTLLNASVAFVAPATATLLENHCNPGAGKPETVALNVVLLPATTVLFVNPLAVAVASGTI